MNLKRIKHRIIAKVITRYPILAKRFIESYSALQTEDIPWASVNKPLQLSKIAIVTTTGIHHKDQKPFNMDDPNGDPSFRIIDVNRALSELVITHDYYDHSDAERDINIIFPIERLWELSDAGIVGEVSERHYSFMGHIEGEHINTLVSKTAPEVATLLKDDGTDIVILTPG